MSEVADYPVLYVFVRTDLQSMSPGKMAAHSGHAANAFVHANVIEKMQAGDKIKQNVWNWMQSTEQGFGTQINLKAPWEEVREAVFKAQDRNFSADIVTDPTYPFIVNGEILKLFNTSIHSSPPVDIGNDLWACSRIEQTAAYIFGMKNELIDIVGAFPLQP